jgi:hypothetical protein
MDQRNTGLLQEELLFVDCLVGGLPAECRVGPVVERGGDRSDVFGGPTGQVIDGVCEEATDNVR